MDATQIPTVERLRARAPVARRRAQAFWSGGARPPLRNGRSCVGGRVAERAALPLVVLAGIGEILGSTLSAWGATDSIAIVAVLGSQFAAIAAVMAYVLFGERLSRLQTIGVVTIVLGVTALAILQA